jgi:oligopeptide transport system substrate-binding protein
LAGDPFYIGERWTGQTIEDLRAEASRRVAAYRAEQEGGGAGPVPLSLEVGDEPGFDLLFRGLAHQLAPIGIRLTRAAEGQQPDLLLVDRIARYAEPRWFLNQFACSLRQGLCDEDVDFLVELAVEERDLAARATLLAEAEAELAAANIYIPLGNPVRWSLIRGNVEGFAPNPWAFHPLPVMAQIAR